MFTVNVYPTKLKPNGVQHYQASAKVEGIYGPITAIARSHRDAIAAVLPKIEAAVALKQRRDEAHVAVLCMCHA